MVYFEKSYPEPENLAKTREKEQELSKCSGLKARLLEDFYEKCYLCEKKIDDDNAEIEHFAPNKNLIRKYSWSNLMLICSSCNKIKSQKENILNPIYKEEKIDCKIQFKLNNFMDNNKIQIDNIDNSEATINTVELLRKIHSKTIDGLNSSSLREKIYNDVVDFQGYLDKYLLTESDKRRKEYLVSIEEGLSNKSPFTAFKRWVVKSDDKYKIFEKYIKD